MEKEPFVELTKELYRLTRLFPKKEPLRNQIRELANDILAGLISILQGNFHKSGNIVVEIKRNLEILEGFFEVAKVQNWVSPHDILEIQNEYSKIKEEIEKVREENKKTQDRGRTGKGQSLNLRQEKILGILKEKEKVQVGQLVSFFPGVSKRTLRRDFQFLYQKGLIERIGEKNNTFYQLKNRADRTEMS